jgi:hypothetical protein
VERDWGIRVGSWKEITSFGVASWLSVIDV